MRSELLQTGSWLQKFWTKLALQSARGVDVASSECSILHTVEYCVSMSAVLHVTCQVTQTSRCKPMERQMSCNTKRPTGSVMFATATAVHKSISKNTNSIDRVCAKRKMSG